MAQAKDSRLLREELEQLLLKLKHNREKVPLNMLKTKYRPAYEALCRDISRKASDYLKQITLSGIRVQEEHADEAAAVVNRAIADSGLLNQLSEAAFKEQDIVKIDALAGQLRDLVGDCLEASFAGCSAFYITPGCLQDIDCIPAGSSNAAGTKSNGIAVPKKSA